MLILWKVYVALEQARVGCAQTMPCSIRQTSLYWGLIEFSCITQYKSLSFVQPERLKCQNRKKWTQFFSIFFSIYFLLFYFQNQGQGQSDKDHTVTQQVTSDDIVISHMMHGRTWNILEEMTSDKHVVYILTLRHTHGHLGQARNSSHRPLGICI